MKQLLIILIIIFSCSYAFGADRPSSKMEVFFKGTDYELHVYRINGRFDGKTMLIIGGIQGDEPGGFLSADLYSDVALEKGNLIIVPRANLKSVILFNRGADGDMNRLFISDIQESQSGKVVEELKALIKESDILLNLHDGWGYHRPEYVDKNRNPDRFGQSLIIDGETFTCLDNSSIALGDMGRKVLEKVNAKITDKDLYIHLFDTRTEDPASKYKNMRKTATWYALNEACVPAFGLEGSKNMKSLEQNVLYHNYMVNEFMKLMDIIPEQPRIIINKPIMTGVTLKINGEMKDFLPNSVIEVAKGDTLEVLQIVANYDRGVTCDVLGYGTLNDINKPFKINSDTKIVFRKDSRQFGEVVIKTIPKQMETNADETKPAPEKNLDGWSFLVQVDGKDKSVADGGIVYLKNGSTFKLIKLYNQSISDADVALNIKGWYPEDLKNVGDDRGYVITFPEKRMMSKYSVDKAGKVFPVVVWGENRIPAVMYIKID